MKSKKWCGFRGHEWDYNEVKENNIFKFTRQCKICKDKDDNNEYFMTSKNESLEEYKILQTKVNTLDSMALQLRIAIISVISVIIGGVGLIAPNIVDVASKSNELKLLQSSIILSLFIVLAGFAFDIFYRRVHYDLEDRGEILEKYLGFEIIRFISRKKDFWWKKWGFVFFYIIISILLIVMANLPIT